MERDVKILLAIIVGFLIIVLFIVSNINDNTPSNKRELVIAYIAGNACNATEEVILARLWGDDNIINNLHKECVNNYKPRINQLPIDEFDVEFENCMLVNGGENGYWCEGIITLSAAGTHRQKSKFQFLRDNTGQWYVSNINLEENIKERE